MITSIRIDRDVPMKTRDGITLSADVYRPDDGKKYPAILSRTPYNKVWFGNNDFLTPTDAAFAGYAFVLQETRGMNNNDEVLEYLPFRNVPHFDFDGLRERGSISSLDPGCMADTPLNTG